MHHRPYSYLYFILHTHKHQDRVWSPIYHSYLIAASHLFVTYNPIHRNATLHICFRSFIVINLMVSAKPHATYYLIQLTSIDINMYSVQWWFKTWYSKLEVWKRPDEFNCAVNPPKHPHMHKAMIYTKSWMTLFAMIHKMYWIRQYHRCTECKECAECITCTGCTE